MSVLSPTLPPHVWKLMTACTFSPCLRAFLNSCARTPSASVGVGMDKVGAEQEPASRWARVVQPLT